MLISCKIPLISFKSTSRTLQKYYTIPVLNTVLHSCCLALAQGIVTVSKNKAYYLPGKNVSPTNSSEVGREAIWQLRYLCVFSEGSAYKETAK
jgi:hypothetical protein